MKNDKIDDDFFSIIRAGLWGEKVQIDSSKEIDFKRIRLLAEEQAVVGLVAAGLDLVVGVKLPKEDVLQFVGQALQLEQRNLTMNEFVASLIEQLRRKDIYAVLVKGQGVALCYDRPLWRACGDVDLLLSENNFEEAKKLLQPLSSSIEEENKERKHIGLVIDSWIVELHGTLHTRQLSRMNKVIDDVQKDVFYCGNVRSWMNGNTTVFLPSPDNDVFFVFAHIIQHYFGGGVGLRQICDWCRLLWTFRESIDGSLLEKRLRQAGMMTEWRAFASLAIEYLSMPVDAMPLYSPANKWRKKAESIVAFILKNGSFGHKRDNSYRKGSVFEHKLGSFKRYSVDTMNHITVFPLDSVKVLIRMVFNGFGDSVINGNRYGS